MAHRHAEREPEFEGGSQPVPDRPQDLPGPARGVVFVLVAIMAFLALLMPVLWGLGALAYVGTQAGQSGVIALWVVWAIVLLIFVWMVVSLWRRAA